MSLALTNEQKNPLALTNESKGTSPTWDQDNENWDDSVGPWDAPGIVLHNETKNALSLTNEAKT